MVVESLKPKYAPDVTSKAEKILEKVRLVGLRQDGRVSHLDHEAPSCNSFAARSFLTKAAHLSGMKSQSL